MERNPDKQDGYIYDPVVKGYDTSFWKSVSGTPAISSNKIRVTSAEMASYIQHIFADVTLEINVPTTPSAGESKVFGLRNPGTDDSGAAYFEIDGATFQVVTKDGRGNTETTTVTWSSYEASATEFRIRWEDESRVVFLIDGTVVATHDTSIPENALALNVENGDADNVDVSYIEVKRAASIV